MAWDKGRPRKLSTTAAGYGTAHMKLRKRYIDALVDGQSCAECKRIGKHHPLYRWQITTTDPAKKLHLSHNPERTGYIGLSAAACNLRDGAVRGRQRQNLAVRYSQMW